ncbi:MAG: CopD family protein [Pseudomonadota bacterium]|nr:CopD family protein [Pseudomonadota bacterium]MEC8996798.1 CopD family protein [Pseudomonadota bacterium]
MLWYKSLHLIFMVTWFAGLFYLPRLFVYHSMAEDEISIDRFKIMERKLFWGIMTPGAILTILFGTLLIPSYGLPDWLKIKLFLIFLLIIYHVWCGILMYKFKAGENTHGHVWYRVFNEVPVILLVFIILLAVFKPF